MGLYTIPKGTAWGEKISLRKYTTMHIGGSAELFLQPSTIAEFCHILGELTEQKIPYCILGKGSNVLIREPFTLPIVLQTGLLQGIRLEKGVLFAECGVSLPTLARRALAEGFVGLAPVSGIPGSLGGAIRGNAGAFGGEISDFLEEVTVFDTVRRCVRTLPKAVLSFSYRCSFFLSDRRFVLLSAAFRLPSGDVAAEREKAEHYRELRRLNHPHLPGVGSIFRRTESGAAWEWIEKAGYRGFSLGGARISEKHCNFIENYNSASFSDVFNLIQEVRRGVYEKHGVFLVPEPEILG